MRNPTTPTEAIISLVKEDNPLSHVIQEIITVIGWSGAPLRLSEIRKCLHREGIGYHLFSREQIIDAMDHHGYGFNKNHKPNQFTKRPTLKANGKRMGDDDLDPNVYYLCDPQTGQLLDNDPEL